MSIPPLPIDSWLDRIVTETLASPSGSLVLTAETGAGKSTAVPQAFLPRVKGRILVLEPRRVATTAVASRIAELLGEEPGQTVGWRMHLDTRVSRNTRIEIITEAILARMIQSDPELDGVSVVILDEFHERSIHADLALALLRDVMEIRGDLRLVVMSATIDSGRISALLDAPSIHVPGRSFPVSIRYRPPEAARDGRLPWIEDTVARAVRDALDETNQGDVLAFLPGIAELRRTAERLADIDAEVFILHSSVPLTEQRAILAGPNPENAKKNRRVILSSSIAETSVTVPGVSIVIDSGLSRTGRLDIPTGMYRLVTGIESEFSATQRAGRAGRTGPGTCVRLWAEHDSRLKNSTPEILVSDLASVVLECALWGVTEIGGLRWLDPPRKDSWDSARDLLEGMGALDGAGRITETGKTIARLGVHPRIAAVALAGSIDSAVRYSGTDPESRDGKRLASELESRTRGIRVSDSGVPLATALLAGFPDRLARHASGGRYRFPSGRIAALSRAVLNETNAFAEWIVAPEVDPGEREGCIRAWEPLPEDDALEWLSSRVKRSITVRFADGADASSRLEKLEVEAYGKIELRARRLEPGPEDAALALCALLREKGLECLPWNAASRSFLTRARFLGLPDMDDASLIARAAQWLVPFVPGDGRMSQTLLHDAIRYATDARAVDRDAPLKVELSNGIARPLSYEVLEPGKPPVPVLEIRIQELFGIPDTPLVAGVPVLLRLLSPARRPLQVTRDLAGFWKNTWPEVRKEMRGRYPKHKWPEDPFTP